MSDALWEDGVSIFRPSYSATWLNCSGSLLPSRYARDNAGWDAAVGTVFHWLMAEWQTNGRPDDWLGKFFTVVKEDRSEAFEIECDEEMFVEGQRCLDRYADIPGDRFYETRVDISSVTPIPNQGGTADLAICQPRILDIVDWKYGKGVQVFAERNTQELLYALGFFEEFDWLYNFQTIRLHIAQPRLNHFDVWEITRAELIEWAAWAKERAYAAWKERADRSPSPKACQWCKVRIDCPALEATRAALADLSFEAIDEPITDAQMKELIVPDMIAIEPARQLSTEQLARILRYRKLMEGWFSDIAEELTTRALQGDQVEGWKIVQGRSHRRWKDEEVAAEKLGLVGLEEAEIFERKIVSPNKSEKLLKAVGIGGKLMQSYLRTLVDRPPGKPTLVPAGDNRLAISDPTDVFDVEDEDEASL